jgi:hypothetical protein
MGGPDPDEEAQRSLNDEDEREEAETDPTVDPDEADEVPYSGE